jgi:signal transduction histidine kinase
MSIRLRLTLWYGALFSFILPLVTVLSYAIHARGQYADLDRMLVISADHAMVEATDSSPHLVQGKNGLLIALRLYSPDGVLRESTLGTEALPVIDPRIVLQTPSGPVSDVITQLLPPLLSPAPVTADPHSAFGLLTTPEQRWRVYVLPFQRVGTLAGYIEALTPLGRVDASIGTFRLMLPLLGLASMLAALIGCWAITSKALRPIASMIQTAQAIASSRDPSRRIEVPAHRDEMGRLATTFNEMLGSLEAASRAQQRFVADASHELRAPLTAIGGNLELLNRHQHMPEAERQEVLAEVTRETERLTRLVADLLALARADAGMPLKQHRVDLDVIVLDAFRSAHQLAHDQTLIIDPFEPLEVNGDEDRLKQLLLILLDNALKYTPGGGQVRLGLHRCDASVELLVHDTGIGIAPEHLPHIFERFYRADPARSRDPAGTGLGLSIAQWITAQHGGAITIESQPGKGTRVRVRLPLSNSIPQSPLSLSSAKPQQARIQ